MSSHHIVRDEQEPALIIANGEACSTELLQQLLEWNPLVLVLDGAVDRVLDLRIKIDILLGDFDRKKNPEDVLISQPEVKIVHTPDQDKTDLEKGIEHLYSLGHKAANIVWATGRRADHSIGNITNLVRYKEQIRLVMYDDHSKIFPLDRTFSKWYPASFPVSLIPVGTVEGITTSGLKYNLNNEALRLGYRIGSSNETLADGFIQVAHQSGDLLMMECFD